MVGWIQPFWQETRCSSGLIIIADNDKHEDDIVDTDNDNVGFPGDSDGRFRDEEKSSSLKFSLSRPREDY